MNQLTAIRSFAKPGFCPVKSTRIQSNKWYLVEMQDIESDSMTDYIGLANTSTIYLYPGNITRQKRDSRLNHCNRIVEYTGNVYSVSSLKMRFTEYYPSIESASKAKQKHDIYVTESMAKALDSIAKQEAMTDNEILRIYGKCLDWPGNETKQIAQFRQDQIDCRNRNIQYWQSDIIIEQVK
jgi:hypothetical protein